MHPLNTKILVALGITTALILATAVFLPSALHPVTQGTEHEVYAFPELRGHLNELKAIHLLAAAEKPVVTLVNTDKGWTVQEKYGYPANLGKLRGLLLDLADIRLLEAKTANAQHYPELGVEPITAAEAKGLLIKLEGQGQTAELIIGNPGKQGGTFVRRPADKQSWLASAVMIIDKDPEHWLDTALLDIGTDQIAEIRLEKPGAAPLRLFKQQAGDSSFQIADIPPNREPNPAVETGALASTLAGLNFSDVISSQTMPDTGQSNLLQAQYLRFDGLGIKVSAWKQDDKPYARFTAFLDQSQAETNIRNEQSQAKADYAAAQKNQPGQADAAATASQGEPPLAVSDPEKQRQQRLSELNEEVDKLNQRLQGWSFVIPAFKYNNMDKTSNNVLKPVPNTQGETRPKPKK